MASLVLVLQRYIEKSKNNTCMCYMGILLFSCIICFATVLHLTDLTTKRVYSKPPIANERGLTIKFHRTESATTATVQTTSTTKLSLVIFVMSAPANKERRLVIRKTWALNLPKTVKVLFVLGIKYLPYGNKTMLTEERKLNQDLIVLPNLVDSYKQLTMKVIESMKWIMEHIAFDYLFKVDDDTFVRVNELLNRLQWKSTERLYWGFFNNGSEIARKGKWAEPNQYICDRYVSYALGGGYVLSNDLVAYIVDNSDKLKKFVNEDVSVGTWLAPLEVNMVHDESFRMKGDCKEHQVILHYSSIDDMKTFNESLAVNNTLCGVPVKEDIEQSDLQEDKTNTTLHEDKLTKGKLRSGKTKSQLQEYKAKPVHKLIKQRLPRRTTR